jgi:hypothetical protein
MDDGQSTSVLEQQIEKMIEQLGSKNAAKRREAAYFLGEAAAADGVAPLVEVYERDKDPGVRAAAAYSLGMYKAIERALKSGDEDEVVELLERIEKEGKLGSRAPVGKALRTFLALLVSLIVLIVLYFVSPDLKGLIFGSTKSRAAVIADVRQAFNNVKNDTRTLQTELLNVISNQPLGCIAFFNNPAPYRLDPADARAFADVATITDQLSTAQASLASAKVRYDDACNNGVEFGAQQAQETFQLLLPALQTLDPIELQLTQAEALQPTAVPPTAVPPTSASAPTAEGATPGLNVTLQPTIPPEQIEGANPKSHLPALFNILDDVLSPRGASTLLVQYWEDVQESGSTTGCDTVAPTVPNMDVFIPEIDFQASPNLREGVQLLNSGLSSLRDGWVRFQFACNSGTLRDEVATRLSNARVAHSAFEAAQIKLEAVRNAP